MVATHTRDVRHQPNTNIPLTTLYLRKYRASVLERKPLFLIGLPADLAPETAELAGRSEATPA
jgi:hypothetical protein